MGLLKKKKKKKGGLSGRGMSSGGSSAETSPLRPEYQSKKAPCKHGCPSGNNIRKIVTTISQTEDAGRTYDQSYEMAYNSFIENSPFLSVCGRVCPHPCEDACTRTAKDGAISINSIERFLGDYAIEKNLPISLLTEEKYDEKVAVVGAGPAGLTCAFHLARRGYTNITVFEAFEKAGGMLRYGIPDYRLPQDVLDNEIQRILDLGITLKTGVKIGKDMPYEKLQEDFDAIFVGMGAHKGKKLRLEGEDAPNVISGVEFLNIINSNEVYNVGDKVLVVGGGDTAIDAARISRRLGADVTIVYRRTRAEMPAIEEEIVGAEKEGVKLEFLLAPMELIKDGDKVIQMRCQRMELGEPDASGRRRPVPIDEWVNLDCTSIIPAISQEPDFDDLDELHEGRDWVKVDEKWETKNDKTWAGGDNLDLGLVTDAIAQGKFAAKAMHYKFRDIAPEVDPELQLVNKDHILLSYYEDAERIAPNELTPEDSLKSMTAEIVETMSPDNINSEAKRCFSCGECFDCGTCWSLCTDSAIPNPIEQFQKYTFKLELCKGCNKCAEACPCGFIDMRNPLDGQIAPREKETGKIIF